MRPEEYIAFDATGLAALVHRGEVTPLELTEAAIERIDALNARLNAVVERDFDRARAAASAMDLAARLAGVPPRLAASWG
jgi:amidase